MLLDLQQVAERLGVHYSTVQEWATNGTLPAFKLAGRRKWSVDEEDLQIFIASQKAGPKAGPKGGPVPVKTGPNRLGQNRADSEKEAWTRKYA